MTVEANVETQKRAGGQINPSTGKLFVIEESGMDSKTSSWIHQCQTSLTDKQIDGRPISYCTTCETPPESLPEGHLLKSSGENSEIH